MCFAVSVDIVFPLILVIFFFSAAVYLFLYLLGVLFCLIYWFSVVSVDRIPSADVND